MKTQTKKIKKKYTRDDLRKHFVVNLMFYEERNCVNFQLTVNKKFKNIFDEWNMGMFGRSFANSNLLEKGEKNGFRKFCQEYLEQIKQNLKE